MGLEQKVLDFIDERMKLCERRYNIQILFWTFRGSLDIGIYRRNSDLDLIFVYKSLGEKCAAIHDIVGYGFDFWGWDIEDALTTIEENHHQYYRYNRTSPYLLSAQHLRGGLSYYWGFFCCLNNQRAKYYDQFYDVAYPIMNQMFEKRLLIEHILVGVPGICDTIRFQNYLSSNDYLYTVWRLLLSNHILHGGLPGESDIHDLMKAYLENTTACVTEKLIQTYRKALSKSSQMFEIKELNDYILSEYDRIFADSSNLHPEHEIHFENNFLLLKDTIELEK